MTNGPRDLRLQATPADFARALARPPLMATTGRDWSRIALERYRVPSLALNLGPSSVHRLTLHLAGPVEIVRVRESRTDRVWSDPGKFNFIPAGEPSVRSFDGDASFMVAYLAPSLVNEVMAELYDYDSTRLRLRETLAVRDPAVNRLGRLLLDQVEVTGPGQRLLNDTLTRALALHLIRAYGGTSLPQLADSGQLAPLRIRRVVDYMHANLADDAPLARLAALVGLGPVHFTRAFRAATGVPPGAYLLRLRITQASRLLEMTNVPVAEIGVRCGFHHPSHFATMFRKRMGVSPSAYRNCHR